MRPEAIVKKAHDAIFKDDPLLLTLENQIEYGEILLHHLLMARTINTTAPTPPLDITGPEADSYRQDPKPIPPKPDQRFCTDYLNARRTRGTVNETCWDELSKVTMVADGTNSKKRNEPKDRSHDVARNELNARDLGEAFKSNRLRIAAIGYRVKVSRLEGVGYFDEELCMMRKPPDAGVPELDEPAVEGEDCQLGRTRPIDPKRVEAWENVVHSHIKKALHANSKIVFLPEFAMPSNRSRGDKGPFTAELRNLSASSDVGDHFLFTGTRHDDRYNRGLIITKRNKKVSDKDWWHYKTASAKNLGENILGPYGKSFPSYKSGIKIDNQEAAITIAICYDTYDPTVFLKYVFDAMKDQNSGYPKIILVPSFNPNDDFVALLRDISFLGRCVVVYVNGLHGDAKLFMHGVALSDIATNYEQVVSSIDKQLCDLDDKIKVEKEADEQNNQHEKLAVRFSWDVGPKDETPTERKKRWLQILRDNLEKYRNQRLLDHLITVEECEHCNDPVHNPHSLDDVHCDRDILYYNIDPQLIYDFMRFRTNFFDEEEFLAKPLRLNTFNKELDERKRRNAQAASE